MHHHYLALAGVLAVGPATASEPWYPGAPGIGQGARLETTEFGGTTTTTGEIDGERFRSESTTFGGTTTTTGMLGGKRFTCEAFEFGGTETRRCR
ncbi:hypothetical protein BDD21_5090 [Thiocapsa rosea]|uniref:Uncharacterized protein n=1 Tax=Thiocapsa rosea TaxID=69360 RepID=A0A495VI11_9GAMM|nr:hypothetical protein BDD21_5090 [Thiocapsa rosea]